MYISRRGQRGDTVSEHEIQFSGYDENGHYYDLDDDAPYDGITVNEADGTITFHEK